MNPELRVRIEKYIESLFVAPDPVLTQNISDATRPGLPAIQVSPNQGKLLYLLSKMCGASRVLEIGTLGGYSTTWLARALPAGGSITSLELDQKHADVARKNVERAGVSSRVTIHVGPAEQTLAAAD
jgi:predicted O-methyltransferase YrrM